MDTIIKGDVEVKFHIGDILSIITVALVSPQELDGVFNILNFMTGDNLTTHQLPRVSEECSPYLLAQHPQLSEVNAELVDSNNWKEWLEEQVEKYGEFLPVRPIPKEKHIIKDPITEFREMLGDDKKVFVANFDEKDDESCN